MNFNSCPVDDKQIIRATEKWLDENVIGLNLCPFAQRERRRGSIAFHVSTATSDIELLSDLERRIKELWSNNEIETLLLIHPQVLGDFYDYNQFLAQVDDLLAIMNLQSELQIASFHPDYQFAGTAPDEAQNYTNRSPYPMLHILREASVERAIDAYAAGHHCVDDQAVVDSIIERNIATMDNLGSEDLAARLLAFQSLEFERAETDK